ncbi:hypothetical protein ACHAWC_006289, partial [Mediolabrus comicus]
MNSKTVKEIAAAPSSSSRTRNSSDQERNSQSSLTGDNNNINSDSSEQGRAEASVVISLPPGAYRVHGPDYSTIQIRGIVEECEQIISAHDDQGQGNTAEVPPLQEAEVELAPVCPEAWAVEDSVHVSVRIEEDEENNVVENRDKDDEESKDTHISVRKIYVYIMIVLVLLAIAEVIIIPTTITKVNQKRQGDNTTDQETPAEEPSSPASSLLASCRLSARLLPSEGRNQEQFGYYIDMSNNTVLVGAPAAGKDKSGAAYIFSHDVDSGDWTEEAVLTPEGDGQSRSEFGVHLALDETGKTAVVAADQENDGTGAVYVFERLSGAESSWVQTAKLVPQTSEKNLTLFPGMQFGDSVDIDGDTIVVGATFPNSDSDRGAVYVFERSLSNRSQWDQSAILTSEEGEDTNARFGRSVQLKEGIMIVGADKDGTNGQNSGAAFIFSRRYELNNDTAATPWI